MALITEEWHCGFGPSSQEAVVTRKHQHGEKEATKIPSAHRKRLAWRYYLDVAKLLGEASGATSTTNKAASF
jgi:hypothetical protein